MFVFSEKTNTLDFKRASICRICFSNAALIVATFDGYNNCKSRKGNTLIERICKTDEEKCKFTVYRKIKKTFIT